MRSHDEQGFLRVSSPPASRSRKSALPRSNRASCRSHYRSLYELVQLLNLDARQAAVVRNAKACLDMLHWFNIKNKAARVLDAVLILTTHILALKNDIAHGSDVGVTYTNSFLTKLEDAFSANLEQLTDDCVKGQRNVETGKDLKEWNKNLARVFIAGTALEAFALALDILDSLHETGGLQLLSTDSMRQLQADASEATKKLRDVMILCLVTSRSLRRSEVSVGWRTFMLDQLCMLSCTGLHRECNRLVQFSLLADP